MGAVERLVDYWNAFYLDKTNGEQIVKELLGPLKEIPLRSRKFGTVYDSVTDAIGDQIGFYPEAYFGFLNDDIREDVLGLFMNPGAVDRATAEWNDEVVRQYTEWKPEKYLEECGVHDAAEASPRSGTCGCYLSDRNEDGCRWRRERYGELRTRFGLSGFRYLHSMELFPFHSRKFDKRIKDHLLKMVDMPFIQLTLQAVREISEQNRVRAIVGIGKAWEDALDTMNWHSKTIEKFEGSVPTRVIRYQSTACATPILILSRQTPNGVKYVIPDAAEDYVCSILGTQPRSAEARAQDAARGPRPGKRSGKGSIPKEKISAPAEDISKPTGQTKAPNDVGAIATIEEVTNRALAQSGDAALHAGKTSGGDGSSFLYKHLWYRNRTPWNNKDCSFHIHVYRSVQPRIAIRFGFNVNKLGWSEEQVAGMKSRLLEIAGSLEMKSTMGSAVYAIEREFDEIERAAECLAALIPTIRQAVEKES